MFNIYPPYIGVVMFAAFIAFLCYLLLRPDDVNKKSRGKKHHSHAR
jgi:hypothetical protein